MPTIQASGIKSTTTLADSRLLSLLIPPTPPNRDGIANGELVERAARAKAGLSRVGWSRSRPSSTHLVSDIVTRQTDRQADRQTGRQTGRQTDKTDKTDRQAGNRIDGRPKSEVRKTHGPGINKVEDPEKQNRPRTGPEQAVKSAMPMYSIDLLRPRGRSQAHSPAIDLYNDQSDVPCCRKRLDCLANVACPGAGCVIYTTLFMHLVLIVVVEQACDEPQLKTRRTRAGLESTPQLMGDIDFVEHARCRLPAGEGAIGK
ncbi:hypothetical protein EJ05DRAFT_484708 [Pseudovirgaria hyperparasitica]|uniref:Uncharacterized protein n=1 Tax=Pseudovirgaria hyperparasitica TaxID=470096 RepID=A0A6A6WAV3_9PEZI|nr:uncharacterized protein EJ05DRAFT_484708 [Pseudovirgaria hyperparasitica]KAF2759803.1 hypothetical protein EJ05DRAFT_484708 [Pseudovirgaria hyperparasitica]